MLTGGRIKAEPLGGKRRWEKAKRKENERILKGLKTTLKKRMMLENILYLMIVNMPLEAELEKGRVELAENKNGESRSLGPKRLIDCCRRSGLKPFKQCLT
jgi:hypothetical protein